MFNNFDAPYTVTGITVYIRELFDVNEILADVWIQGEVSNMKRASSGHWYFTLKDGNAQMKCVMWRSSTERQTFIPNDGDAIVVHGRVSVYDAQGAYQLYADSARPLGVGDLYGKFEALKAKLQAEGLFDEERKRPLPTFPKIIGVVTSPEAAAFQDIQNVLRRRYPLAEIMLSPSLVQGADAPPQIVKALERLNAQGRADVIMLIRGGGSIEDLWAFNDERVARAIITSQIPIVSGVGHETDFTIADFVADLRAPTPSAAAELATPNIADLRANVRDLDDVLRTRMDDLVFTLRSNLGMTARSLGHISPAARIRNLRQRVDDWNTRLISRERAIISLRRERLVTRISALNAADPRSILSRGYAIVTRSEDGARLAGVDGTKPGTGLTIQFADGELKVRVEDKESHERYTRTLF